MTRTKAKSIAAATNQEQAELMVRRIGEVQREITRIECDMNDRLNPIKQQFEDMAKPLKDEMAELQMGVQVWAEANKSTLLTGKAKTVKIATGDVGWRTSTPAVRITGGVAVVIERLKQLGLHQFLRIKEEVNKEAILANPQEVESVKGVNVTQVESFWIRPFGSTIEIEGVVK